jgi:hypothetical protein
MSTNDSTAPKPADEPTLDQLDDFEGDPYAFPSDKRHKLEESTGTQPAPRSWDRHAGW